MNEYHAGLIALHVWDALCGPWRASVSSPFLVIAEHAYACYTGGRMNRDDRGHPEEYTIVVRTCSQFNQLTTGDAF